MIEINQRYNTAPNPRTIILTNLHGQRRRFFGWGLNLGRGLVFAASKPMLVCPDGRQSAWTCLTSMQPLQPAATTGNIGYDANFRGFCAGADAFVSILAPFTAP